MRPLLLLVFLLCFSRHCLCATITFDSSQEHNCLADLGGCDYMNTSIWIGNTLPSITDSVVIAGSGTSPSPLLIFLPPSSEVTLANMLVINANFQVTNESTLSLAVLELEPASLMVIMQGAVLQGSNSSNLTLSATARLHVHGNILWIGDFRIFGEFVVSSTSYVQAGNTTYAPLNSSISASMSIDYLNVPPNSEDAYFPVGLLVSQEVAIAENSSIFISGTFLLGDIEQMKVGRLLLASNAGLTLSNSSAILSCPDGTYGTGNIDIVNSHVNIDNPVVATFNGTVSLSGLSTAQFVSFSVRNLHLGASTDSVTVIGNGLAVVGIADGYGVVNVGEQGLNISGLFSITGPIQASNSTIYITANGSLVLSGDIFDITNTTVLFGGKITGDFEIPETAQLNTTYNNATIYGTLTNRGGLHVAENRILYIKGDFIQTNTGVLRVDLVENNQSAINITNATVSIGGTLQYKLTKIPFLHSAKFPILSAENSQIKGNFNNNSASALSSSLVHRVLQIQTIDNVIFIIYDFSPSDVQWWEWVIMAVVGAGILVIALSCIFKFRANRKYQYEELA